MGGGSPRPDCLQRALSCGLPGVRVAWCLVGRAGAGSAPVDVGVFLGGGYDVDLVMREPRRPAPKSAVDVQRFVLLDLAEPRVAVSCLHDVQAAGRFPDAGERGGHTPA
jgi:hypothetical protein